MKATSAEHNVLLLGETGSGKSTVINMIVNFCRGGNVTNIKVAIPTKYLRCTEKDFVGNHSEQNVKDTTKSQTAKCTIYKLATNYGKFGHFSLWMMQNSERIQILT